MSRISANVPGDISDGIKTREAGGRLVVAVPMLPFVLVKLSDSETERFLASTVRDQLVYFDVLDAKLTGCWIRGNDLDQVLKAING